jgi:hypothetical protein
VGVISQRAYEGKTIAKKKERKRLTLSVISIAARLAETEEYQESEGERERVDTNPKTAAFDYFLKVMGDDTDVTPLVGPVRSCR